MDTRIKIVDSARAASIAAQGATVVSGYFDPLIAAHAERLAALKTDKTLLILIATPDNAILPAAARAELVASLKCVDFVSEVVYDITPEIRLEQEDDERFSMLLKHVHARQTCAY